jgi:hypothetical protein
MKPQDPTIYLLEVSTEISPHSSRLPIAYSEVTARQKLNAVAECVRHAFMDLPDEQLPEPRRERRDRLFAEIEDLVSQGNIGQLLTPATRPLLISKQASLLGVLPQNLRKLLTRFWWYGCDKNALLDLTSLKGGAGRYRDRPIRSKRGRRNAVAKEDPSSRLRGANYDDTHRKKFIDALTIYWKGQGLSLAETYRQMRENIYRIRIVKPDGTIGSRRVPAYRIPSLGIFYRVARRLIAELDLKGSNLGPLDYVTKVAAKSGSARDIADGPLDIFDVDATEFEFELVAAYDPSVRIGKPTVYLVVDRFCSYIVGLYLECRPERWDGYRRALYCAFTDRRELLARLELSQEYGLIWHRYGVPNAIFSDRGPARSNNALDSLCGRLVLEKAGPPPHRPDHNPVVESLHGKLQQRLSYLPGGYTRKAGERAATRRKGARTSARLTEKQFLRILIAAAHDHNTLAEVRDALRPEMVGVQPTPDAIFAWGLENTFVEHQGHDAAELYANLLPVVPQRAVTPQGIRYKSCQYDSPELQAWRRRQVNEHVKTDFYPDGDPQLGYWRNGKQWCVLPMVQNDRQRTAGFSWLDIEKHTEWMNKMRIVRGAKSHKTAVFPKVAEAAMREAMALEPASGPSRAAVTQQSIRTNRKVTETLRQREQAREGARIMYAATSSAKDPSPAKKQKVASKKPSNAKKYLPSIAHLR